MGTIQRPRQHCCVWVHTDAVDTGEGVGKFYNDAGWDEGGAGDTGEAGGFEGRWRIPGYSVGEAGDCDGGGECNLGRGESAVQLC